MQAEDRLRVAHMVEACETAIEFVSGRERTDLDHDKQLLFAVVHAIEIVGEAASKVSDETQSACPSVPWRVIKDMRNRLSHAYFDINKDIVWKTVAEHIPALLSELRTLLPAKED